MGIVYVRMRHTVAFIFFFSEKVGWLLGKVMELLTRGESGRIWDWLRVAA